MGLPAPNFIRKPWKLGTFQSFLVHITPSNLDQIVHRIARNSKPRRSSSVNDKKKKFHGRPFLTRNLASGIKAWPEFERQFEKFLEKRRSASYKIQEIDAETEEDLIIRRLAEGISRDASAIQRKDVTSVENEEDEVIRRLGANLADIPDARPVQMMPNRSSENCKDTGYESHDMSSSTSYDESEDGDLSDLSEDENSIPYVPDISANVIQDFFRKLNSQPLKCFYTIWHSYAVMKKYRIVSTLIPQLEKLSESKVVLAKTSNPPKDGVSGKIDSLDDLSSKARKTLSLWNIVTTVQNPDSAEESGVDDGPLERWNDQFLTPKKGTPVSRGKLTPRTPNSSGRRVSNRTPVSSATKRPNETPISSARKRLCRTTPSSK